MLHVSSEINGTQHHSLAIGFLTTSYSPRTDDFFWFIRTTARDRARQYVCVIIIIIIIFALRQYSVDAFPI